jgi:hypothetical protein
MRDPHSRPDEQVDVIADEQKTRLTASVSAQNRGARAKDNHHASSRERGSSRTGSGRSAWPS